MICNDFPELMVRKDICLRYIIQTSQMPVVKLQKAVTDLKLFRQFYYTHSQIGQTYLTNPYTLSKCA